MRLLVLGGTVFLGQHIAAEAVRRGHDVVCAARGTSGTVPVGARLIKVDRDDPDGLAPLATEGDFDGVVDVATVSYPWVARALTALADRAAHWTFVSTINVYADLETPGQTADAPLLPPRTEHGDRASVTDPAHYGSIKVASENAVRETVGDRAFIVRPGLISGPGDAHDRFGYWPARMSRPEVNGGRVVVPDVPDQPIQYIDVRDLATWVVDAAETRLTGDFDATGEVTRLPELLAGIAEAVGVGVELVPVSPSILGAAQVNPWSGPRSLPLWLPAGRYGVMAREVTASVAAGLRLRPLADAANAALEYERTLGLDRVRKAGLTTDDEAELLAMAAEAVSD
jgi:2'-hydroxyisoflavone reductase